MRADEHAPAAEPGASAAAGPGAADQSVEAVALEEQLIASLLRQARVAGTRSGSCQP